LLHGEPGAVAGSIELNGRSIWPDPQRFVRSFDKAHPVEIVKDTMGWDAAHRRLVRPVLGRQIGMVFQEPVYSLDPRMTIARQFDELLLRHVPDTARNGTGTLVRDTLAMVELDFGDISGKTPSQLSGGECQRVSLAMAVILRPALLLCDEPTTAVDVEVRAQLHRLLARFAREEGSAVLLVSHHWPEVRQLADRIVVMSDGQVVEWISRGWLASAAARDLHPVTAMWRDGDATLVVSGETVNNSHQTAVGCPLAGTCGPALAHATEFSGRCSSGPVPEFVVRDDQRTRCWLFEGNL
jgi:ABC-type glutathione transport system ATPase component